METLDARGPIGPLNPAWALRRAVALVLTAALYACGGGGSPGPDPAGTGSAEGIRQPMDEARSDKPEGQPGKIEPFVAEVTTNSYLPVLSLEMGELPQYELPVPEGEDAQRPRRYGSIDTPADADRYHLQQIVVKFHEGTGVRLRKGTFTTLLAAGEPFNEPVKSDIDPKQLDADLLQLNDLIAQLKGRATPVRMFEQVSEAQVAALRERAWRISRRVTHDLDLFHFIALDRPDPKTAAAILKALAGLPSVESAYIQARALPSFDIAPQTMIDLAPSQGYFGPAPSGIDVSFARRFAGGRGQGVRIVDIETGFYDDHEDLPGSSRLILRSGWNIAWHDHGTAVLGMLWGEENGFGVNGMTPMAGVGWSSPTMSFPVTLGGLHSIAGALLNSGLVLRPGDVALIEQQVWSPAVPPCPQGNPNGCDQWGLMPVEVYPAEDATIRLLVAAGVTVVEAAGNGQQTIGRASGDSGAIMVGAGGSGSLMASGFSNNGSRLDVHGWGDSIATLGYGPDPSLQANGNDPLQWYMNNFGGTSGASPMVVGAAALVQSTRAGEGLPPLSPTQMRTLLVLTGTPQAAGPRIGPRPDLRRALASFIPDRAAIVAQSAVPTPVVAGATFAVDVTVANTGAGTWNGSHQLRVLPMSNGTPWSTNTYPLGLGQTMLMGDRSTRQVLLTAPSLPGTYALNFGVFDRAGSHAVHLATGSTQYVIVAGAPGGGQPVGYMSALLQVDPSTPGTLPSGATGQVTIIATNNGTLDWTTAHSMQLGSIGRLALPANTVAIPATVRPGQSVPLSFDVKCNSSGPGGFSATLFGISVGRNLYCQ